MSNLGLSSPPEGESERSFSAPVGGMGHEGNPPRICKCKSRSPSRGELRREAP